MRLKSVTTLILATFVVAAIVAIFARTAPPVPPVKRGAKAEAAVVRDDSGRADLPVSSGTPAARPDGLDASGVATKLDTKQPVVEDATVPGDRPTQPRTGAQAEAALNKRKIVATYFHGNVRCATCKKVEAYAREAVEEGFRPEVASGVVEFRAVNVEAAENEHYVEDFQLTNKSVIVTEEVNGVVSRWAKLDDVWGLVGNRDAYLVYVRDAVRGYLETQ